MKRLLILALILLAPVSAQDHLEQVYGRENKRLDILVQWSPGQEIPELPPVIKFEPEKREAPPAEFPLSVRTTPKTPTMGYKSSNDADYTAWILNYNKSISLTQAEFISRTIQQKAQQHSIDPKLVVALVATESAFRNDARSPVGAQGLGQLMPGTAAMLGVSLPYDPSQNLDGTVRYLSTQLRRWGSPALALASYNAGPGAVQKYGGIPPYRETQEYVHYVLKLHQELKGLERQQQAVSRKRNSPGHWPE